MSDIWNVRYKSNRTQMCKADHLKWLTSDPPRGDPPPIQIPNPHRPVMGTMCLSVAATLSLVGDVTYLKPIKLQYSTHDTKIPQQWVLAVGRQGDHWWKLVCQRGGCIDWEKGRTFKMRTYLLLTAVGVYLSVLNVSGVPKNLFYPFGSEASDFVLQQGDDVSSNEFPLNTSIAFFDKYYRSLYVSIAWKLI